jgi:hypothetical protein
VKHSAFPWRKAILFCLLLLGAAVRGEPLHAQEEGGAQKVILYAGDEAGRAALNVQAAQLIADYGAFSLWQVPQGGTADLSAAGLATRPELDQLLLREATLDTRSVELGAASAAGEGEQFYLVQFAGPVRDEWLADLRSTGAQVVAYVPYDGYVVWGGENARAQIVARVTSRAEYGWHGPYRPAYRLAGALRCVAADAAGEPVDPSCDPSLRTDTVDVVVQVWDHTGVEQTVNEVLAQAEAILREPYAMLGYRYFTVRLPALALVPLAARADVLNVEPYRAPVMLDERQGQIMAGHLAVGGTVPSGPGYLDWITSTIGFPQQRNAYPIVDVIDDGSTDHLDFYQAPPLAFLSRLRYERNLTSDPSPRSLGGHGPINLSIVGGYPADPGVGRDGAGYLYGLGISPFGSIASTKVFNDEGNWDYAGSYADLIAGSYRAGARISSNSWGVPGDVYTVADQQFDALTRDADPQALGNQAMIHVFAGGNEPDQLTYPASAKNVIGVGASENVRPDGTDGCGFGPTEADNAQDIASFSSRGPTADGRAKPDIVAPGTHIQGAASQEPGYAGWNPLGVCNRYWPVGQTLYTWSSGTSHAAPAVAGALSLIQVYLDRGMGGELLPSPSPAMLKAYLLNTGRRLVGDGTGGAYASLPDVAQGWGLVDLGRAFDGVPRLLIDQDVLIDHSGQQATFTGMVANTGKALRVTLAWTDVPGAPFAASWVNDLDLEVIAGGQIYHGNVFFGSTSLPGTGYEFDRRDNVEAVYIPAGVSGPLTVRVTGYNIAGDGVPGNGDPTDQDFALVIYNGARDFELEVAPSLGQVCGAGTLTYTVSASALPAYGETVSLTYSVPPPAGGITLAPAAGTPPFDASLQVTAGDTTPSGHYTVTITSVGTPARAVSVGLDVDRGAPTGAPALASPGDGISGVALRPTFSWQAVSGVRAYQLQLASDPAFASPVIDALVEGTSYQLEDELNEDTVYYWRVAARNGCGMTFSAPRALVTVNQVSVFYDAMEGGAGAWTVSNPLYTTQWALLDEHYHSPLHAWHMDPGPVLADARLAMAQPFAVSATTTLHFWQRYDTQTGSDGGVLEISVNGGPWQDLGEHIVAGGYDRQLSGGSNALAGRWAWSGNSGGWRAVEVDLSAYAGSSARVRYRWGSDDTFGGLEGWYVDDVHVIETRPPSQAKVYLPFVAR